MGGPGQDRSRCLHQEKRAAQVDSYGPLPVGQADLAQFGLDQYAGADNERVQSSQGGQGVPDDLPRALDGA
jgi:hypothetical protein